MKAIGNIVCLIIVSALTLTGCQNTVEGFGKDMQNTGQEIQKATH